MARPSPRQLVDEIAESGGAWSLYGARFARKGARRERLHGMRLDHVWVELDTGRLVCTLEFSGGTLHQIREVARAAERAGYHASVLEAGVLARRLVHAREFDGEVARLAELSDRPRILTEFPARAIRPLTFSRAPFFLHAVERMRGAKGWSWEWAGVSRFGSSVALGRSKSRATASCSVLNSGDDVWLDVGASLVATGLPAERRFGVVGPERAALVGLLTPLGYRELQFRRVKGNLRGRRRRARSGCSMIKEVRGLGEARRERARLDELLFGAPGRRSSLRFGGRSLAYPA